MREKRTYENPIKQQQKKDLASKKVGKAVNGIHNPKK